MERERENLKIVGGAAEFGLEEKKRRRFEAVGAPLSGSSLVGMVLISNCVLVVGLEEKKLDR